MKIETIEIFKFQRRLDQEELDKGFNCILILEIFRSNFNYTTLNISSFSRVTYFIGI